MNFSASDLVKRSAAQILYRHQNTHKKKTPASDRQIRGEQFQNAASISKYEEMRGQDSFGQHNIFFCIDEVFPDNTDIICLEIKSVDNPYDYDEWYLNNSILQSAYYLAMLLNCNSLRTATFAVKRFGYKKINLTGKSKSFILQFGDIFYEIKISNPRALINHYRAKARAIASLDYGVAKEWDREYKFKDYDLLKRYIQHRRIQFSL